MRFLLGRLLKVAITLFAILVLNFFLIRAAPGDPAMILLGETGSSDPQILAALRAQFGLDQSVLAQLWLYIKGYLTLDMGYSFRRGAPVFELIAERLPATLILTMTAFLISLVLGVIAGTMAARRRGRWSDTLISAMSLLFYATPLFWLALMASLLFSLKLGWLPAFGYETVGASYTGLSRVLDIGHHLILPAMTLGLFFTAVYARMTRASMLEVAQFDFVRTARAKGLHPSVVTRRHMLRNALLPIVTLAGLQAGQLVGGAVLIETVFAWPGIGRLMFEAIAQRDYNVILGVFFVSGAIVLLFNLITDFLYVVVDPRIRLQS